MLHETCIAISSRKRSLNCTGRSSKFSVPNWTCSIAVLFHRWNAKSGSKFNRGDIYRVELFNVELLRCRIGGVNQTFGVHDQTE
jgi:hypothetical protein